MAVVSKDELLKQLKGILKEDTSDEAIALLENVSDTIDSLSKDDVEDLKKQLGEAKIKLEELDKSWREKYTTRFNSPTTKPKDDESLDDSDNDGDEGDDNEPTKFEDLFSTGE